ncbi:MAG: glycosyltransferase family 2 protein [Fimbriiglobus sp.]
MISVLILTKDEELNLPRCLDAARWSDDVVVLDSESTDRTVAIAEQAGARVFSRPWDSEPAQRGYSLGLPFKYPWVYNPDADEVATPELVDEMRRVTADPGRPEVLYRVRRKDMFMGRWLRRSSLYPTWFPRLFRPQSVRFERAINMVYLADGPEGRLDGHLTHYSFNKGFHAWFEKHNMYSTLEAREALAVLAGDRVRWRSVFSGNPVEQRRAIKDLSFRLPFRSAARFIYAYLVCGGFLDGRAGFTYCRMTAMYEQMIDLKIQELRLREQGRPL